MRSWDCSCRELQLNGTQRSESPTNHDSAINNVGPQEIGLGTQLLEHWNKAAYSQWLTISDGASS